MQTVALAPDAVVVRLIPDFAPLQAFLAEASALLLADGDRPLAAKKRFAHQVFGLIENGRGISMDCAPATATGEVRVTCQVSDELRSLVAAFRAGN